MCCEKVPNGTFFYGCLPFSVHEGSGLGNVERDMKKTCVGANVKPGLAIYGSNASNAKSDVEKWIKNNLK